MFITISILTYNRKDLLKLLLWSLQDISSLEFEIIVVDNCSQDGTMDMMSSEFNDVRYYRMSENIGVGARNVGFENARGDIIITIDDDIFGLDTQKIIDLLNYFKLHERVGALNFKVVDHINGKVCNWIHHREVEQFHDHDFLTYEITEGAVAFRKKALHLSGHYPDSFFLSHEGPDLAFRIMDCGFEVHYSGLVTVVHSHAKEGRKNWFRYYYDTRNQFLLAMRNLPLMYSVQYLSRGFLTTFFYSARDGFLPYWFKGIIDGLTLSKRQFGERKILSQKTMKIIREIDKKKPSVLYMLKKRIFRNEMRL